VAIMLLATRVRETMPFGSPLSICPGGLLLAREIMRHGSVRQGYMTCLFFFWQKTFSPLTPWNRR
jgi:hypothetical protein